MSATAAGTPGWSDASVRGTRTLAALFAVLQFVLYTPPAGVELPFSRWLGAAIAAPLFVINLIDRYAGHRLRRFGRAWPYAQLMLDSLVAYAVLWIFAFDAQNALWAMLVLPVLEGAMRAELRGALVTWLVLAVGYALRDFWASAHYAQIDFYADSVTYRMGILGIVAITTGNPFRRLRWSAERLDQRLAEAAALRQVAVAARRLSSLEVDVITAEVITAAVSLGSESAWLRGREPAPHRGRPRLVEVIADCGSGAGTSLHAPARRTGAARPRGGPAAAVRPAGVRSRSTPAATPNGGSSKRPSGPPHCTTAAAGRSGRRVRGPRRGPRRRRGCPAYGRTDRRCTPGAVRLPRDVAALSLDDFGTGYSSMSYLQRLPVDELKVDRSFVTHLRPGATETALVRAVVDLAHSLGLTVVAEGVETQDTLDLLRTLGCDVAEGFHLGRSVSGADIDLHRTSPWPGSVSAAGG